MHSKPRILVTGATGFVGRAFLAEARSRGLNVRAVMRRENAAANDANAVVVDSIHSDTDWNRALSGCSVVVHLAARVHVMDHSAADSLEAYRVVNVEGTLNLARQAVLAGVKRFIFVSSIKVNGECTQIGKPYTVNDSPAFEDAYGLSKAEAEAGLKLLAHETGLELVIIRPPLVYGPGVKGNFSTMLRWLQLGVPLPLGASTSNRRSLVALANLVDLLVTCTDHPAAANETFLVSDGEDLSTTDLLLRLGGVMGKQVRLLPVPHVLLQAVAKLLGKGDIQQRLLGNLQVDISHTFQKLGWKPPICVDEGLRRAVRGLDE